MRRPLRFVLPLVPLLRLLAALAIVMASMAACGPAAFTAESTLDSVRILATKIDHPYAKPGDTVNLEVLAVDAREGAATKAPMRVFWLPFPCINPQGDLYYACFGRSGADAGVSLGGDGAAGEASDGGVAPALPLGAVGTDLTPLLREGTTFQATVPADIVSAHPPVAGVPAPYGLMIFFNMACAGHVEVIQPGTGPQAIPLGCVDDQHNPLSPSEFVLGFTRVYVYDDPSPNANPVIDAVTFAGQPVTFPADPAHPAATDGITLTSCSGCDSTTIDVSVPQDSWEVSGVQTTRGAARESIWVDYFTTVGTLDHDARLLYDSLSGRITDGNDNGILPPSKPAEGHLYVVVHDDRDGVDWRDVPVHVH